MLLFPSKVFLNYVNCADPLFSSMSESLVTSFVVCFSCVQVCFFLIAPPWPTPLWIILVGLAEAFDDRVQIISCLAF